MKKNTILLPTGILPNFILNSPLKQFKVILISILNSPLEQFEVTSLYVILTLGFTLLGERKDDIFILRTI